jgi:hypothetical protein
VPYRIEVERAAEGHLRDLTARQQRMVRDAVRSQLVYQPTLETRNRKPMRGKEPIAPWELRAGISACITMLRRGWNLPFASRLWGPSSGTRSALAGRYSSHENH